MKLFTATLISIFFAASANAAITISNFSMTTNSMSYTINGTIDAGATLGTNLRATIIMGVPGDNDWIIAQSTESAATVINHAGIGLATIKLPSYTFFPNGDYFYVTKETGDWAVGDSVNSSVTMTGPANSLVPGNVNVEDIIVTVGYNSPNPLPDTSAQVGAIAVPEPSSIALLGLGSLALIFRRRR